VGHRWSEPWKIVTEETPELPGIRPNGGNKP
jgi:hypothetical protein